MPIGFLSPLFLAGLAALAVPVLIHLAHRPRTRPVRFPSLMFIERVEYRASSRRRLRNLVLFTLRALALVLLAAAFARPFIDRPDGVPVAVEGGRELVVLLDRSASMAAEDRMERARQAVGVVAASLRRGDRATLVLFDHAATAANRATDQPAVLTAAADTVRPGAGATQLAPALRLAESILSTSPLPRRELVLVSDFQRSGWEPESAPRMPEGTDVRVVPVGAPIGNAAVTGVAVARERFSGRERARFRARVVNRGPEPFSAPVELEVDGRVVQAEDVTLEPDAEAVVELGPLTLGDGATPVTLRAGTDLLPVDNLHRLVLEPGRGYRVLVVESPGADAPYLERALEAGGEHRVARVASTRFGAADLGDVDVVVLHDTAPIDDAAAQALLAFADGGGGVIVALGARSRTGAGGGLLPGSLEGTRDRGTAGATLASIRHDHPLLRPLRDAPAGVTAARFYRYRELEPAPGADVVARYDDGGAAVVAATVGAGRVVVLTAPLDGRWSDLVLRPAFVPLVHGLVRHAAGREPAPPARTVGELLDAGELAGPAAREAVLLTPSGRRLPVEGGPLQRLDEAGFYEIRDPRSTRPPPVVAVNLDPAESVPEMVDAAHVESAITGGPPPVVGAALAPEDRERGQSLWWAVLAAVFLVAVAETALANGLSRRSVPAGGGA